MSLGLASRPPLGLLVADTSLLRAGGLDLLPFLPGAEDVPGLEEYELAFGGQDVVRRGSGAFGVGERGGGAGWQLGEALLEPRRCWGCDDHGVSAFHGGVGGQGREVAPLLPSGVGGQRASLRCPVGVAVPREPPGGGGGEYPTASPVVPDFVCDSGLQVLDSHRGSSWPSVRVAHSGARPRLHRT